MGSDLAVFSGLDAEVERKEWEKGKSAHVHREQRQGYGIEARICVSEGGVRPEDTGRPLKHQKFILVSRRSRLTNKKRLERSP